MLAACAADWADAGESLRVLERDAASRERLRAAMIRELAAFLGEPGVRERLARVVDALHAHETLDETLLDDALG